MTTSIATAIRDIGKRCRTIIRTAEDPRGRLASFFSTRENRLTVDACFSLATAVARANAREIAAVRDDIVSLHEQIMSANCALSQHLTLNPLTLSTFVKAEETYLDLLLNDPATAIRQTKRSLFVKPLLHLLLSTLFADIRHQIEASAKARTAAARPHAPRGPQSSLMAAQRKIFADFLKQHPVSAAHSAITRAHECWNLHRQAWDEAARRKTGYSGHKALARTV